MRNTDMTHFTLIGYPTLIFKVVREFTMLAGTVPCVKGVTLDGKRQTVARVADVNATNA